MVLGLPLLVWRFAKQNDPLVLGSIHGLEFCLSSAAEGELSLTTSSGSIESSSAIAEATVHNSKTRAM
jgi:hypothetical protein